MNFNGQAEIKNFVEGILGDLAASEKNSKKIEIGEVSDGLRRDFKNHKFDKRELEAKMELRVRELEKEAEIKLAREFDEKVETIEANHKALWRRIYDELNIIESETEYSFNSSSGKVFEVIKKSDFNF